MAKSTISDNDRRLVVEHLCGELDVVQQNELAQRLHAEPALRALYVSLARTNAALPSVLQATRQRDRRTRVIKLSTYAGVTAAAAAIIISVLAPLLSSPPQDGMWGTSGTFAIEGSGNVNFITDNGAKDWSVHCETDNDGAIALALPGENTVVDISENSDVQLLRDQDHMAWAIESGRIRADVDKQAKPLTIDTQHARATVLGTELIMSTNPKQSSLVVTHGNVMFATPDQQHEWLVTTGRRAIVTENGFGIQPSLAPKAPAWDLGDHLTVHLTDVHTNQAKPKHSWVVRDIKGQPTMVALPDRGKTLTPQRLQQAPRLDIHLNVTEPGTWRLWLHGRGSAQNNTVYFGLNGEPIGKDVQAHFAAHKDNRFHWASHVRLKSNKKLLVTIKQPGTHTLNLWMREDGVAMRRVFLTRDLDSAPTH